MIVLMTLCANDDCANGILVCWHVVKEEYIKYSFQVILFVCDFEINEISWFSQHKP